LALRDQVKASSVMAGRALPSVKLVWPGSLTQGVTVPVRSVVVPSTRMVLPVRLPLIRIDGVGSACGVTGFEDVDQAPHPAPLRARAVKV
jgi:hypothetical protein